MTPALHHLLARLPEQDAEDLEKIEQATASVTTTDIVVGFAALALAWPVALGVGWLFSRAIRRIPGPDHAKTLIVRLVRVSVAFVGLAIALSRFGVDVGWFTVTLIFIAAVLFLMLRPLLENLAAGLVLETRRSFGVGDEIKTKGYTGEVIELNGRTTVIKQRDWRRVHIPSSDVLEDPIVVFTAFERRRSSLELWVADDLNLDHVTDVVVAATTEVDGVLTDPPPSVMATGFGNGTIGLELRWWHPPGLGDEKHIRNRVVRALAVALPANHVRMPAPELLLGSSDGDANAHPDGERSVHDD